VPDGLLRITGEYFHYGVNVSYRLDALSSTRFTQAERVSPALVAAREYRPLSSGVSRTCRYSVAGCSMGGLPLGFLALSMPNCVITNNP
jgi:hypothetical protein